MRPKGGLKCLRTSCQSIVSPGVILLRGRTHNTWAPLESFHLVTSCDWLISKWCFLFLSCFFFPEKVLRTDTGLGFQPFLAAAFFMAARMLLSSSLFLLARMCVPTLLLMIRGPLALGDLERLHGTPLVRSKPHTSWWSCPAQTWSGAHSGSCASACFHPWSPCGVGEAHGHGVARSPGCCSSVAARGEGQWCFLC